MHLLLKLRQTVALGFAALWARYPNHNAKKDAEKAYGQVVTTPEIDAEVHKALDWQLPHWETLEWYHPPYLATYLRKERFRDPKPEPPKPKAPPLPAWQVRQMDQVLEQAKKTAEVKRLIAEGMERSEAMDRVWNQPTTRNRDTTG